MLSYRKNINKSLNLVNYKECKKLIVKHEFTQSGKGVAGDIYKVISSDCGCVIIKIFKSLYTMKKECSMQKKVKEFIDKKICGNFIDIIECDFDNKYIVMEYADNNLFYLFDELNTLNDDLNTNIIFSLILQILIGLLCFQKKLNLFHGDFALRNILYKKIEQNITLCYTINSQKFYIPTFGYLVLIIDFGSCREINNAVENLDIFNKTNSLNSDLEKLLIKKILNNYNQIEFISIFLSNHKQNINKVYNEDKKIYLKNIRKYIKDTKFNKTILNYDELIKKGINTNIIFIKKIIDSVPELIDMIQKIYKKSNFSEKYKSEKTVNFTLNYNN
jgi:hypothetical protein